MFQTIVNALQEGIIVITPTHRLQREILWNFVQSQAKTVVIKPECYALESWLLSWFDAYELSQETKIQDHLLSETQFQFLVWRLFPRNLSPTELNSWITTYKNLCLALAEPEGSDFLYQAVPQQFQTSYARLHTYLQTHSWLPKHKLSSFLSTKPYPRPKSRFLFCCFDTLHPQHQQLLAHLAAQGHEIQFYDLGLDRFFSCHEDCISAQLKQHYPSHISHYVASSQDDEEEQMVLWVLDQINAGKQRIGLVVPDLSEAKARLYRRLQAHLPRELLHCSLGNPLTDYPLIKQGLVFLFLNPNQGLKHDEIKLILYSPWIAGAATEVQARQFLAQSHRLLHEPELPWTAFLDLIAKPCPKLHKVLTQLSPYPKQASPKTWLKHFATRLEQLEFAHAYSGDAEVCQKFYLGLDRLHELEDFEQELESKDLETWLVSQFQQEIHQAPQDYHGVHLMGWLESSGFCGDALWFCHCLSQFIPQAPAFSSWLPMRWQKDKKLPRTAYETETQIAKTLLMRLIQANQNLVFSYPKHIEQQIQWPSPLFLDESPAYSPLPSFLATCPLERIEEPLYLPLGEHESLRGGSQLLSSYASCPFQAFAKYRLHTQAPIEQHFGLDARESGQLMHQALFYFWQDHRDLSGLSATDIEEGIHISVTKALREHAPQRPYSLDPFLTQVEHEKLVFMLRQVLEFDKARPHFKIYGLEQELMLEIEGVEFKLRYDRIDQLDNGDLVLIDYKSSLPSPLPWRQSEPLHPQILLYALAQNEIQALMFGAIRLQGYQVTGISAKDLKMEGIKTSSEPWSQLQQQWLLHLRQHILQLKAGDYQIKPANSQVCARCLYQDLCRIED